mmetsp:Transcript_54717/g.114365  ORF Transcript_54717/g.114365 Transcript_54717/m.114365 type:complete len:267 (-) Transcript_54717:94-894(-)
MVDDAGGGEGGAGREGLGGGGGGSVWGVVGAVCNPGGDDGEVVLEVVGAGVLALAPLHEALVVAHAHDGRPAGLAGALARVVADGGGAVVAQAEGVPRLVARRLGDVLDAVAEHVREDEAGLVVAAHGAVDADVGEAAAAAPDGPDAGRDEHAQAVLQVGARRAEEEVFVAADVLGRHVDVEGRVVLRDARPDLLDVALLRRREAVGGPVPVARRGVDCGVCGVIPGSASQDVAVEVQVEHLGRAWAAVKLEHVHHSPSPRQIGVG